MAWFELSKVKGLRLAVEELLIEEGRLPSKPKSETAAAFWERLEKAGLLEDALLLYDEFASERENRERPRRESKKVFAERIAREGRQDEVERERESLLECGFSLREIQGMLVDKFQPLDGSKTCQWETPNSWQAGRMFRKKEERDKLLAEMNPGAVEIDKRKAAEWRFHCAEFRRGERVALAKARERLSELQYLAWEEQQANESKGKTKSS